MIHAITPDMLSTLSFQMGECFFAECDLPGNFKIEAFRHNWELLIKGNIGAMWRVVIEGKSAGFLGAILMPDINDGEMVASEMFWYMHPAHRSSVWGIRLFITFEKWAKEVGAKRATMVHLVNAAQDTLGKFFERRGYKLTEKIYVKEL